MPCYRTPPPTGDPTTTSNSNPKSTPLSIFPQAKKQGLINVIEMNEEEIQNYRQQLGPQKRTVFDAAKIIADELWPKTKKIVQYPPNAQQHPITLQPKPAQVLNSWGNKQQILGNYNEMEHPQFSRSEKPRYEEPKNFEEKPKVRFKEFNSCPTQTLDYYEPPPGTSTYVPPQPHIPPIHIHNDNSGFEKIAMLMQQQQQQKFEQQATPIGQLINCKLRIIWGV